MANTRAVTFTPLVPKQTVIARDAVVVWEPSVFGGDGSEKRLNLVLRVADHVREVFHSIEADAELGRPLCSVIRDDTIKVKIDTTTLRVWDADEGMPVSAPEQWKGRCVHACIEVRGFWQSRTGAGLSAVCTDLQLEGGDNAPPAISPFLQRQNTRTQQQCSRSIQANVDCDAAAVATCIQAHMLECVQPATAF